MLIHDLNGNKVPLGRIQRTLEENFITANALPSWLTMISGTANFVLPATDFGWVEANTGVGGTQAFLGVNFFLDSSKFDEIIWTVEGVHFSTASATLSLSIAGTNCGVRLRQAVVDNLALLRMETAGGVVDTNVNYQWRNSSEHSRRRNLTLVWRPKRKEMYAMEGDQIIGYLKSNSMTNGQVRPSIGFSGASENNWFRCSQIRLTLVHN